MLHINRGARRAFFGYLLEYLTTMLGCLSIGGSCEVVLFVLLSSLWDDHVKSPDDDCHLPSDQATYFAPAGHSSFFTSNLLIPFPPPKFIPKFASRHRSCLWPGLDLSPISTRRQGKPSFPFPSPLSQHFRHFTLPASSLGQGLLSHPLTLTARVPRSGELRPSSS